MKSIYHQGWSGPRRFNVLLKTKLTVLLLVISLLKIQANSYSPNTRLSLDHDQISMDQLLNEIENKTEFSFLYKNKEVDINRIVSVHVNREKSGSILDQSTPVHHELRDTGQISISSQTSTTLDRKEISSINKTIQEITVTGTIVDTEGTPLVGATVLEKGTTNGVISDFDGNFTINVANEDAVLAVSYIGFATKEILITGQSNISVVLEESAAGLDEVVVVGYGTVSKFELTSSVSHVSSKDFLDVGANSPIMLIQGKAAGVSVANTSAADPNSNPSIQVRGVSSRSAGLGPLIVIDGVPGGNLRNINENDIESMDVLKGGAASAIYGTRGSNGVILITTKSGNLGFNVIYKGNVTMDLPRNELPVLTAEEFREHLPARGVDFGGDTDWFKEITRVGVTQKHALQISGGSANSTYNGTVDVRDAHGIDLRSGRKEIGARLSLSHSDEKNIYKITMNVAPRKIESSNYGDYRSQGAFSQALSLNPTMPVFEDKEKGEYFEPTTWEAENPVEKLKLELDGGEIKYFDWDGTFKLDLFPLFGSNTSDILNTQITVAQQLNDQTSHWFRPSTSTLARKNGYSGEVSRGMSQSEQRSLEWFVNYELRKAGHGLKVLGGYSYQDFSNSGIDVSNKNFTSDALTYNSLQDGTYMSESEGRLGMSSYKNDARLVGFFSRVSYDYERKYLFTASLRYEGSSKFGANNKWGYFPGVSLGWRISEENFLSSIGWINELKVRTDYGITGNQDFSSYKSLPTMSGYGQVFYNGSYYQGWSRNSNVNSDLSWELGINFNLGVDFSLFDNRLYGDINYYNRTQKDLLGNYTVPIPPNIESSTFVNVGTMKNSGIEIAMNYEVIRGDLFNYNTGIVAFTTNNRFVSFSDDVYEGQDYYWLGGFPAPGSPGPVQQIRKGERIGTFFTFEYAGVDERGNWLVKSTNGETIPISNATDSDKRVVGNGLPKFTLSWNNSLQYRNFDFVAYFQGKFGYQVYNTHEFYWGLQSAAANLNVLKTTYTDNKDIVEGGNAHNSYFVQDADHLKLDVLTIGYTVQPFTKAISDLRFYITGKNLFTISKFDGVDLDVFPVNGLEPGVPDDKKSYYPSVRQLLLGVSVKF